MSRFERDWRIRWMIAILLAGGVTAVIYGVGSAAYWAALAFMGG